MPKPSRKYCEASSFFKVFYPTKHLVFLLSVLWDKILTKKGSLTIKQSNQKTQTQEVRKNEKNDLLGNDLLFICVSCN